jgi:hypothetical protein
VAGEAESVAAAQPALAERAAQLDALQARGVRPAPEALDREARRVGL